MKELIDINAVVEQMNLYGLNNEMENVLGNAHNESQRLQFIKYDYITHINRVHNFIINKLNSEPHKNIEEIGENRKNLVISKLKLGDSKLEFNPEDGITLYRGAEYIFSGKSRALLTFLNKSKNTPFTIDDVKSKCNSMISKPRHYFREDKDTRDTVNYIRKMLKVSKGEFFPIRKSDDNWIWIEK